MRTRPLCSMLCVMVVSLVLAAGGAAWADCGSIPFEAPPIYEVDPDHMDAALGSFLPAPRPAPQLDFNPLDVLVYEPQQRAIILWNGQEEILLLSTDQSATQRSAVLEVIPLPAEPQVRLGSFETFDAAKKLAIEKRMWACAHGGARADLLQTPETAGRIAFHKKMGAHELAVAEVLDKDRFTAFVQDYIEKRYQTREAPIRPEFIQIIDGYLAEGFRWFAFDVLALDDKTASRQPVEYRFACDEVFYPLKISRLEKGETEVNLLVFATRQTTTFEGLERKRFSIETPIDLTRAEVEGLEPAWAGFFGESETLVLNEWKLEGKSEDFLADVRVK
ncbi:DUF2330 domain-containing protein [Candidatus Sumerlaeota bacterium]|nr:DUF2330 domain-containing protein [Candidatus Sumerlaeota bacterium]